MMKDALLNSLEIQNLLILGTILTTLGVSMYTGRQNNRAFNIDINFRALDKRKRLLAKIEPALVFFTDELDSSGYYYPLLKDSEIYDSYFEEEDTTGPAFLDIGDVLRQKERILPLLQDAAYIFPNAEKEIKSLCNQLSKFVKIWDTSQEEKDFNKAQKMLKKTSKKALNLMKLNLDIRQFSNLKY